MAARLLSASLLCGRAGPVSLSAIQRRQSPYAAAPNGGFGLIRRAGAWGCWAAPAGGGFWAGLSPQRTVAPPFSSSRIQKNALEPTREEILHLRPCIHCAKEIPQCQQKPDIGQHCPRRGAGAGLHFEDGTAEIAGQRRVPTSDMMSIFGLRLPTGSVSNELEKIGNITLALKKHSC